MKATLFNEDGTISLGERPDPPQGTHRRAGPRRPRLCLRLRLRVRPLVLPRHQQAPGGRHRTRVHRRRRGDRQRGDGAARRRPRHRTLHFSATGPARPASRDSRPTASTAARSATASTTAGSPGDTVAVVGEGVVGLSAVQGAKLLGATRIIAPSTSLPKCSGNRNQAQGNRGQARKPTRVSRVTTSV